MDDIDDLTSKFLRLDLQDPSRHKAKSESFISDGASVAPIAAAPRSPPPLVTPAPEEDKTAKDSNGDSGQPAELMAAIRNFASTGLRPVSSLLPQTGREFSQTPGDSILVSIQMELEKRRVHISDSETECEDDSSNDSDWK